MAEERVVASTFIITCIYCSERNSRATLNTLRILKVFREL